MYEVFDNRLQSAFEKSTLPTGWGSMDDGKFQITLSNQVLISCQDNKLLITIASGHNWTASTPEQTEEALPQMKELHEKVINSFVPGSTLHASRLINNPFGFELELEINNANTLSALLVSLDQCLNVNDWKRQVDLTAFLNALAKGGEIAVGNFRAPDRRYLNYRIAPTNGHAMELVMTQSPCPFTNQHMPGLHNLAKLTIERCPECGSKLKWTHLDNKDDHGWSAFHPDQGTVPSFALKNIQIVIT